MSHIFRLLISIPFVKRRGKIIFMAEKCLSILDYLNKPYGGQTYWTNLLNVVWKYGHITIFWALKSEAMGPDFSSMKCKCTW